MGEGISSPEPLQWLGAAGPSLSKKQGRPQVGEGIPSTDHQSGWVQLGRVCREHHLLT